MNTHNPFYAFQFQDKRVFHENVHPVAAVDLDSLVLDRKRQQESKCNSTQLEFVGQTLLIRRLQQSWAQVTMDLNSASNYPIREFIEFHLTTKTYSPHEEGAQHGEGH
jgi:hypothetical protein